jgi:hypothetical protein
MNNPVYLGVVVHACNFSTREARIGGSQVGGQPRLHRETLSEKRLIDLFDSKLEVHIKLFRKKWKV